MRNDSTTQTLGTRNSRQFSFSSSQEIKVLMFYDLVTRRR